MKIRSLGNTSFDLIFETFNRTFAAYVIAFVIFMGYTILTSMGLL